MNTIVAICLVLRSGFASTFFGQGRSTLCQGGRGLSVAKEKDRHQNLGPLLNGHRDRHCDFWHS